MHIREMPFEVFLSAELVPALVTLVRHLGGRPMRGFEAMAAKGVLRLERSAAIDADLLCRHAILVVEMFPISASVRAAAAPGGGVAGREGLLSGLVDLVVLAVVVAGWRARHGRRRAF